MLKRWNSVAALAACVAMAGTSGCDDAASRGVEPLPADSGDDGSTCEIDPDVLLQCSDENCDLEALADELADCQVADKADGIGDTIEDWLEDLQQALATKAEDCYVDEDVACLERVYFALAAGAKVKGLGQAAAMMWNFLQCGQDPKTVDAGAIGDDANVQLLTAKMRQQASMSVSQRIDLGTTDATVPLDMGGHQVTAADADIYYAMGTFTVLVTGTATIAGGELDLIQLDYQVIDRYDWHAGLGAGGGEDGVSEFSDDWAVYLVEQGAACEFDMRSSFSESLTELELGPVEPPSPNPGRSPFTCDDGETIDRDWVCNGWNDCSAGEDELDCVDFECSTGETIPAGRECDDFNDCPMGEDEHDQCR